MAKTVRILTLSDEAEAGLMDALLELKHEVVKHKSRVPTSPDGVLGKDSLMSTSAIKK